MWWLVALLAACILFSYVREGLEVTPPAEAPENPTVKSLLQENRLSLKEIKTKVDQLVKLESVMDGLKSRIEATDQKLTAIADMKAGPK